jgi:hypothetical protein
MSLTYTHIQWSSINSRFGYRRHDTCYWTECSSFTAVSEDDEIWNSTMVNRVCSHMNWTVIDVSSQAFKTRELGVDIFSFYACNMRLSQLVMFELRFRTNSMSPSPSLIISKNGCKDSNCPFWKIKHGNAQLNRVAERRWWCAQLGFRPKAVWDESRF